MESKEEAAKALLGFSAVKLAPREEFEPPSETSTEHLHYGWPSNEYAAANHNVGAAGNNAPRDCFLRQNPRLLIIGQLKSARLFRMAWR